MSSLAYAGDHKQLRPQVGNYDLSIENPKAMKKNLDLSTFERLSASPNFPVTGLTVQRRMRPEIATLIRPIYEVLFDHDRVNKYPHVTGMYHNLYWFDHSNREDHVGVQGASRSNKYEVDMATQLVSHLCKQGSYETGDIAVITPYAGQLRKLRDSLSRSFEIKMSDQDEDDLAKLQPLIDSPTRSLQVERNPLTESVRIATVSHL